MLNKNGQRAGICSQDRWYPADRGRGQGRDRAGRRLEDYGAEGSVVRTDLF